MEYKRISAPFEVGTQIVSETDLEVKYQIDCDTSDGVMHNYHLFPGIDISYTTFAANYCFQRNTSINHVIEIAYCSSGRYECEYKSGYMTYLGEGDFAVGVMSFQRERPFFPTGYYGGLAIIVDTSMTGESFYGCIEGVRVDFRALVQKYCNDHCCTVMKAPPALRHVFEELSEIKSQVNLGYLRTIPAM